MLRSEEKFDFYRQRTSTPPGSADHRLRSFILKLRRSHDLGETTTISFLSRDYWWESENLRKDPFIV
jgi:hypothetical protein